MDSSVVYMRAPGGYVDHHRLDRIRKVAEFRRTISRHATIDLRQVQPGNASVRSLSAHRVEAQKNQPGEDERGKSHNYE